MVMLVTTAEPRVQWTSPAPLWPDVAGLPDANSQQVFRQPTLLRFVTDSFMDEFLALVNNEPARLKEWRAQPETWQEPAATPAPVQVQPNFMAPIRRKRLAAGSTVGLLPRNGSGIQPTGSLKLYQPAHQRFYLVSACLVCRVPGLPDRTLDTANQERATFVMRRLRPSIPGDFKSDPADWDEYAFVTTPRGNSWQKVADSANPTADVLVPGEEQLPLFGVTYIEPDNRKRRVLAGYVPVGKREAYLGAGQPSLDQDNPPEPVDPRKAVLLSQVTDPWRSLIAIEAQTQLQVAPLSGNDRLSRQFQLYDQITLLSWYALLDFADYLEKYLPTLWSVILGQRAASDLSPAGRTLYATLLNTWYDDRGTWWSLLTALTTIQGWRTGLESATEPYATQPPLPAVLPFDSHSLPPWPDFHFLLSDPALARLVDPLPGQASIDDLVVAALEHMPTATPPLPLAAQQSILDGAEPAWFVIRCVFERPNCGPLMPPVVSDPTPPFQLAAFFEPNAPARPVRISLPFDLTPAGLRKYAKNSAFVMSDAFCGMLDQIRQLTLVDLVMALLPPPLHKDLPKPKGPCIDGGIVCSLSIPIVTICAFILLTIIVNLLNMVFKWLPYFITCFPLPNFKAKEPQ
jgi:hypothetical protein